MNQKQTKIMTILSKVPIVSTDMIYTYFKENGSPDKRASENLRSLMNEKLIEKQPREIGKTCLWRLTKKGRDLMNITRDPIPFNTPKIEHILDIGKCAQWLDENGELTEFIHEPHYPFGENKYCPDAYFIWNRRAYVLEVQRSYLSAERWKAKWKVAEEFFQGPFKKASFQINPAKILKPQIICISVGNPTTLEGLKNLFVLKDIEQMKELFHVKQ